MTKASAKKKVDVPSSILQRYASLIVDLELVSLRSNATSDTQEDPVMNGNNQENATEETNVNLDIQ